MRIGCDGFVIVNTVMLYVTLYDRQIAVRVVFYSCMDVHIVFVRSSVVYKSWLLTR